MEDMEDMEENYKVVTIYYRGGKQMYFKYFIYAIGILILYKIIKVIYTKITVSHSSQIDSIAAEMSLYVIDTILNNFMDDNRFFQVEIMHQDKVNYSYEISAIAFGYITRLSVCMLDDRQARHLCIRLEKWCKARLRYRGTGSIANGYVGLALDYAKQLTSKKYLMGNDGALILLAKYNFDDKIYEIFTQLDSEISAYIHDNYKEKFAEASTIQEIRQEFNK